MAGKRILVVDDDETVRMVVRLVLAGAGFQVTEALDGEDALHQLTETGDPFDLVLLDQNMPKLSGRETLGRLRQCAPTQKVVMLSGVLGSDLEQLMADPCLRFLAKPFQNHELVQVVKEALED